MSAQAKAAELMSRPYIERRLIVVSNRAAVEAAEAAVEAAEAAKSRRLAFFHPKKPETKGWTSSIVNIASNLATQVTHSPASKMLVDVGIHAVQAVVNLRNGGAPTQVIGYAEAAQLSFPPGHPRENVVYVCHPVMPNTYYTMADFHRVVFEHKFAEAMRLLMSLGAATMKVERVSGWSRSFAADLAVSLPVVAGIENSERGRHDREKDLLFTAAMAGTDTPFLPNGLAWFPHEPIWQAIAEGRLNYRMQEFSLSVNYRDDFGVDTKLRAEVEGAGLQMGGKFEAHEATVWRMDGVFGIPASSLLA